MPAIPGRFWQRLTFRPFPAAAGALAASTLLAAPGAGQAVVKGRVIEEASRAPLVAASVALLVDEAPVVNLVTDSLGNFVASVRDAGRLQIRVSRIGYTEILTRELDLGPTDTLVLELRLAVNAVPLEPMEIVAASRPQSDRLSRWGYHERRDQYGSRGSGFGRFLDRDEIRSRIVIRASQLLRDMPRIRIVDVGGRQEVRILRARGPCRPTFYVDGHVVPVGAGFTIDDHVTSGSIVALEIYPGMVTPTRYPSVTGCGSIVIWTGVEDF